MEYAIASPSQAHTIGNITAFMTDFVKNMFPPDYFKTVNIASQIAYRQFNVLNAKNRNAIVRRGKPILIVRPRVDVNNEDGFLANTLLTTRMTDNIYEYGFGNLQDFVYDPTGETAIKFLMNRVKVMFDVSIIVETSMEQLNMAYSLKNTTRMDKPFFLETFLENHIPRQLIEALAKDKNIPMENVKELLDYMNSNSVSPLSYKMKNSTGNDEFFRFYPAEIETIITNFEIDDGSRKNMIDDAYTINFTVTADYWSAGLFYYFTRNPKTVKEIVITAPSNSTLVPMLTSQIFGGVKLPVGWDTYASAAFKVDTSPQLYNLNFAVMLNDDIRAVIEYSKAHGLTLDGIVSVVITKDAIPLVPGTDYTVDIDNTIVKVLNTNNTSTYRFVMTMNTLKINELIISAHEFSKET